MLIEGGPGAAFEAQQFSWNGNYVIPVKVTGGAAAGLFNVPQTIFQRPPTIDESDWSVLGDSEATPSQISSALVRIIRTLNFEALEVGPRRPRNKMAVTRGSITRSETLPHQGSHAPSHTHKVSQSPQETRKRTFSDTSRSQTPGSHPGSTSGGGKLRTATSSYS